MRALIAGVLCGTAFFATVPAAEACDWWTDASAKPRARVYGYSYRADAPLVRYRTRTVAYDDKYGSGYGYRSLPGEPDGVPIPSAPNVGRID